MKTAIQSWTATRSGGCHPSIFVSEKQQKPDFFVALYPWCLHTAPSSANGRPGFVRHVLYPIIFLTVCTLDGTVFPERKWPKAYERIVQRKFAGEPEFRNRGVVTRCSLPVAWRRHGDFCFGLRCSQYQFHVVPTCVAKWMRERTEQYTIESMHVLNEASTKIKKWSKEKKGRKERRKEKRNEGIIFLEGKNHWQNENLTEWRHENQFYFIRFFRTSTPTFPSPAHACYDFSTINQPSTCCISI